MEMWERFGTALLACDFVGRALAEKAGPDNLVAVPAARESAMAGYKAAFREMAPHDLATVLILGRLVGYVARFELDGKALFDIKRSDAADADTVTTAIDITVSLEEPAELVDVLFAMIDMLERMIGRGGVADLFAADDGEGRERVERARAVAERLTIRAPVED